MCVTLYDYANGNSVRKSRKEYEFKELDMGNSKLVIK